MNLSVGIVGLPNAGKSTLFNALLKKQQALAANYPFATIEPNIGIVPVPDERLTRLATIEKEELKLAQLPPIVAATIRFVDIAGLVKGASTGEGLGNKFLAHIREVDIICHVVRYFTDDNVIHVAGKANPQEDISVVNTELMLADLQVLEKQQQPKQNAPKEEFLRYQTGLKVKKILNEGILPKREELSEEEYESLRPLQLLTMKPMFYIANVHEEQLSDTFPENTIPVCAKIEEEVSLLSEEEQKEYLSSMGVVSSGLDNVVKTAYSMLRLISFLTAGEKEVRAWTILQGTTAEYAAATIHTDFLKHFIKAEVVSYDEFVEYNGWRGSRLQGKTRFEGRTYCVHDGDVIEFKIGT